MSEIILEQQDLQNINYRNTLLFQKDSELKLLQREREVYMRELLNKYKLDPSKAYTIDHQRGLVQEKKDANNNQGQQGRPDNSREAQATPEKSS